MWLILERDAGWLESRAESWWKSWCWYILRGVIPDLAGEPSEPKQGILGLLNENSPATVCQEVLGLASGQDDDFGDILPSLLPLLLEKPNTELDEKLCAAMRANAISERNVNTVGKFVLTRAPEISIPVCLDILNGAVEGMDEPVVETVAVSLLRWRAGETWDSLKAFEPLAKSVFGRVFA